MLFQKVATAPPSEVVSTIWHFGWGAEDMKAAYQKQLDSGPTFATPITDISDIGGGPPDTGRFFYAYVLGPDGALIELNTAQHDHFGRKAVRRESSQQPAKSTCIDTCRSGRRQPS
jgi:hypothetical protein